MERDCKVPVSDQKLAFDVVRLHLVALSQPVFGVQHGEDHVARHRVHTEHGKAFFPSFPWARAGLNVDHRNFQALVSQWNLIQRPSTNLKI